MIKSILVFFLVDQSHYDILNMLSGALHLVEMHEKKGNRSSESTEGTISLFWRPLSKHFLVSVNFHLLISVELWKHTVYLQRLVALNQHPKINAIDDLEFGVVVWKEFMIRETFVSLKSIKSMIENASYRYWL